MRLKSKQLALRSSLHTLNYFFGILLYVLQLNYQFWMIEEKQLLEATKFCGMEIWICFIGSNIQSHALVSNKNTENKFYDSFFCCSQNYLFCNYLFCKNKVGYEKFENI